MIKIRSKDQCCGCSACVQRCPVSCISFRDDEEGFNYPEVDINKCINCGLCEKVCPYLVDVEIKEPIRSFAAKSKNTDEMIHSSSGGIFPLLAKHVLINGGKVYGAAFDRNWNVRHISIDNVDDLTLLQGSKYVQSILDETFKEIENELKHHCLILFSGLPCQIEGLKLFLRKDFDNLITVEVACHGVPSPLVWNGYKNLLLTGDINSAPANYYVIKSINFRDKRHGWDSYGLSIEVDGNDIYQPCSQNLYMRVFLKNFSLRPSCFNCPAKNGRSKSDVLIADFWGVKTILPNFYDKNGVSIIIAYSQKGLDLINNLTIDLREVQYSKIKVFNEALFKCAKRPGNRDIFWKLWADNNVEMLNQFLKSLDPSFFDKVKGKLRIYYNKFFK